MRLVGGSQGRPTGLELRGCIRTSYGPNGKQLIIPCSPAQNIWKMIMTNDWYYGKGNVNSTTGGVVSGGALAARRRRT